MDNFNFRTPMGLKWTDRPGLGVESPAYSTADWSAAPARKSWCAQQARFYMHRIQCAEVALALRARHGTVRITITTKI